MGEKPDDACPFTLNFDPSTFKAGDLVSYRVPGSFGDTPFLGEIVAVEADHVLLRHHDPSDDRDKVPTMRGTRESRPVVSDQQALGD
jgi:hypothetical protein